MKLINTELIIFPMWIARFQRINYGNNKILLNIIYSFLDDLEGTFSSYSDLGTGLWTSITIQLRMCKAITHVGSVHTGSTSRAARKSNDLRERKGLQMGENNQVTWLVRNWNHKVQGDKISWVSVRADTYIQEVLSRWWDKTRNICPNHTGR